MLNGTESGVYVYSVIVNNKVSSVLALNWSCMGLFICIRIWPVPKMRSNYMLKRNMIFQMHINKQLR